MTSRPRTALALVASGALAAGALATGGLALLPATAGAAGQRPPAFSLRDAGYGAGYLVSRFATDGGFGTIPTGGDDAARASNTVDAVLAIESIDSGRSQVAAGLDHVEREVDTYVSGGGDSAGALAKLVIAVVAAGRAPTDFGGSDLVARLLATRRTSGKDKGLFGRSDPTYDGAFRQGLALSALAADRRTDADGIAWLRGQQCADGAWQAYRPDTSIPCAAYTDDSFRPAEDTNQTAYAVAGLAAQGAPLRDAVGYLAGAQLPDAGFTSELTGPAASSGAQSDANSTGVVLQGLVAAGVDPSQPPFLRGSATPYSDLEAFQVPQDGDPSQRGAYDFLQPAPGDTPQANDLATFQAVLGAAGRPFPLAVVPTPPAPAPAPGATAAPAPTAPPAPAETATGSALVPCRQVILASGRRSAYPAGCLPLPASQTPCTVGFDSRGRKGVLPRSCLPVVAAQTLCTPVVASNRRLTVVPRGCQPTLVKLRAGRA